MLKYVNWAVVFSEIPDEVTLAINISNCPCRCPGCHSKFLWGDVGEPLDETAIDSLVSAAGTGVTCVSFMGGDASPAEVNRLAMYVRQRHKTLKVAWYTGRTVISSSIDRQWFDYIKVGPYIAHLGALPSCTTNQRLYRISHPQETLVDITSRFWKH